MWTRGQSALINISNENNKGSYKIFSTILVFPCLSLILIISSCLNILINLPPQPVRSNEEERKREERNRKQREYYARRKAEKTTEEREARNKRMCDYRARKKAETGIPYNLILLLAPIRAPITALRTCGSALCTGTDGSRPGADGPRPGARLRFPAWRARRFAPRGRTVRACAGAVEFVGGTWISLQGGTPSGRRDPRLRLGSAGHPRHL
jgi:hypothetical protein